MRIQIRQGVFETNSSSMHAICVCHNKNTMMDKLPKEVLFESKGVFDCDYEIYNTIEDKADYLYTLFFEEGFIDNEIKDFQERITEYLESVGVKAVFSKKKPNGYINHQSLSMDLINYVFQSKEHFLNYLFNDGTEIFTMMDCVPTDILKKENHEFTDTENYDIIDPSGMIFG